MARVRARVRRRAGRARGSPPARGGSGAPLSAVLEALKRAGPLTTRELAATLGITYEGVRQQLRELVRAGWVSAGRASPAVPAAAPKPGRASRSYALSAAAEQLFPKHYDALSIELVQQLLARFGGAGMIDILARMTDARVARWAPLTQGKSLRKKLAILTSLYRAQDAYMEVEWREGAPALIERNCPFLSVAQQHPAICSVSVNTLERLLGYRVVREQRFQAAHGRCVFRLRLAQPRPAGESFALET